MVSSLPQHQPQIPLCLLKDYKPPIVKVDGEERIGIVDHPYIAVVGRDQIYHIDHRHNEQDARYIKDQLEHLKAPSATSYLFTDETTLVARWIESTTGDTLFTFNPAYSRVFFATTYNRKCPDLNLPIHPPAGYWLQTYDFENLTFTTSNDPSNLNGDEYSCRGSRKDAGDPSSMQYAPANAEIIRTKFCGIAYDSPRWEGETDTNYYQRMDELHWGHTMVRK